MALQHQATQRNPAEEHLGYACAFQMHITILIQVSAHKHQHTCSFHPIIQDPQMLDQLAKNITRCGLSNSTLNYLRVSKIMFILDLIFKFNPHPRLK